MGKTKEFSELSIRQKNRRTLRVYKSLSDFQNFNRSNVADDHGGTANLPGPSVDHSDADDRHDSSMPNVADCDVSMSSDQASEIETESDSSTDDNYPSSDSDVGDADSIPEENISHSQFSDGLREWAIESGVSQKSLTQLLHLHREHGFRDLPLDARTLLNTPRSNTFKVQNLSSGKYVHYGLGKSLEHLLIQNPQIVFDGNVIRLDLNIDGLPIAKSTKSQLWPILCKLSDFQQPPFLIGAYHGYSKAPLSEFLQPFVDEFQKLQTDGFRANGTLYNIQIRAVVCDSPARSYVTCTKAHNGYFGCGKCTVEGASVNRRMTFAEVSAPLRTDEDFKNRAQPEHHLQNDSPFELISVPMVTCFPLDYMHNSCLGVTKQMLRLWSTKSKTSRVAKLHQNTLSVALKTISEFIPMEFCRKCFDLEEFSRWKATQFRTFLLYLGPAVLTTCLPVEKYLHFNALNCAMRVLCSADSCAILNNYANDLLVYFVENMPYFYGQQNVTYNVHNLIHLAADVTNFGALDAFSAFPFENHLFKLKKLLRKFEKPLEQICHRLVEQSAVSNETVRDNSLQVPQLLQKTGDKLAMGCTDAHKKIVFPSFTVTTKQSDNCCYVIENNDVTIVCIEGIGYFGKEAVILGRSFLNKSSLPNYPCDSTNLGIYVVQNLSDLQMWPVSSIEKKGFRIPLKNDSASYLVLPLLHINY